MKEIIVKTTKSIGIKIKNLEIGTLQVSDIFTQIVEPESPKYPKVIIAIIIIEAKNKTLTILDKLLVYLFIQRS